LNNQIELETAIFIGNPNATPSPKLKQLQQEAIQLTRKITVNAKINLDKEATKETSSLMSKVLEQKDNINNAADGALTVMNDIQEALNSESRDNQKKNTTRSPIIVMYMTF